MITRAHKTLVYHQTPSCSRNILMCWSQKGIGKTPGVHVPITLVCIVEMSCRAVLDSSLSDVMTRSEECLSPRLQHSMTQALIKTYRKGLSFFLVFWICSNWAPYNFLCCNRTYMEYFLCLMCKYGHRLLSDGDSSVQDERMACLYSLAASRDWGAP